MIHTCRTQGGKSLQGRGRQPRARGRAHAREGATAAYSAEELCAEVAAQEGERASACMRAGAVMSIEAGTSHVNWSAIFAVTGASRNTRKAARVYTQSSGRDSVPGASARSQKAHHAGSAPTKTAMTAARKKANAHELKSTVHLRRGISGWSGCAKQEASSTWLFRR